MRRSRATTHALALLLVGASAGAEAPSMSPEARLERLVEDYFEEVLRLNPVFATAIGDDRYNDRLPNDIGPEHRAAAEALERRSLEALERIERERLGPAARLSYDVFERDRRLALEGLRFPAHLLPFDQFQSFPSFFAEMGSGGSIQPFRNAKDYEDFLWRIDGFSVWADQAVANMREGLERGVVQPRVVAESLLPQLEAHVVERPEDSIFYGPVRELPETLAPSDRERLAAAYYVAIGEKVVPAYRRLAEFVRREYLPRARETTALTALPLGAEWYAHLVRVHTTTELMPEAIHATGLQEVDRILGEMRTVQRKVGFEGDLEAFFRNLESDERFYFERPEELLAGYRELQRRINARLPRLFDIAPKADYEVREVEAFRAASAAGASYLPGTPDGSRPGIFYVNTFNLKAQPRFGMETLSLHEASPGHHFQISIQQEQVELPRFRRFGGYTAFVEGWALYAESLGTELGLFDDPYQHYGRLSDEMLRAMRLVVDTGIHASGWSRERAIAYMLEGSSLAESDVVAEVERYIAVPGQALAYKVGQLEIARLRERAQQRLGARFDVKAFHRELLLGGALPLDVLGHRIDEWIAVRH